MELNPADYYRIDWGALNDLPPGEKMGALAKIFEQVRADIGAERGRMAHQAHADHGTKKAAAEHLGLSPARFGQIYDERKKAMADTKVTRVAYDFGTELHIMDVDERGVYVDGTAEVLPHAGDRDSTLQDAGYQTHGEWVMQGEAEGITVERQEA
ncbi:hypothetical protein ABZ635_22050 [Nocardiopsis sp. NPDC007018]|uniref:hypothetical protein n=1 Tax=Nocardiopsis sp. NPDC007018 TaxID=3155721 RepID=UPI0033DCE2E9